jgi:hypothetical protein
MLPIRPPDIFTGLQSLVNDVSMLCNRDHEKGEEFFIRSKIHADPCWVVAYVVRTGGEARSGEQIVHESVMHFPLLKAGDA